MEKLAQYMNSLNNGWTYEASETSDGMPVLVSRDKDGEIVDLLASTGCLKAVCKMARNLARWAKQESK